MVETLVWKEGTIISSKIFLVFYALVRSTTKKKKTTVKKKNLSGPDAVGGEKKSRVPNDPELELNQFKWQATN